MISRIAEPLMDAREVLSTLESLAKRPEMYVHPVSFDSIRCYLHGLATGLKFAGIEYSREQYELAANARGFDPKGSIGILRDFRNKGLTDEEMNDALIAVEADAYRRTLGKPPKQGDRD